MDNQSREVRPRTLFSIFKIDQVDRDTFFAGVLRCLDTHRWIRHLRRKPTVPIHQSTPYSMIQDPSPTKTTAMIHRRNRWIAQMKRVVIVFISPTSIVFNFSKIPTMSSNRPMSIPNFAVLDNALQRDLLPFSPRIPSLLRPFNILKASTCPTHHHPHRHPVRNKPCKSWIFENTTWSPRPAFIRPVLRIYPIFWINPFPAVNIRSKRNTCYNARSRYCAFRNLPLSSPSLLPRRSREKVRGRAACDQRWWHIRTIRRFDSIPRSSAASVHFWTIVLFRRFLLAEHDHRWITYRFDNNSFPPPRRNHRFSPIRDLFVDRLQWNSPWLGCILQMKRLWLIKLIKNRHQRLRIGPRPVFGRVEDPIEIMFCISIPKFHLMEIRFSNPTN